MDTVTLDDFMAFNDEIVALIAAGVPLDVGLEGPDEDVESALGKINAIVARRVSRGATLPEALEDNEPSLPAAYRSLVLSGLRTSDLSSPLGAATDLAVSAESVRNTIWSALVYPLVVCGLAFLGLIGFCLWFVPVLANMHEELQLQPGPGLRVLYLLREWLPYWIVAMPAALLAVVIWDWRSRRLARSRGERSRRAPWCSPGASVAMLFDEYARFALTVARLDSAGTPLAESLRIASESASDEKLRAGAQALAARLEAGAPEGDKVAAVQLPPFLNWATLQAEGTVGRSRALEMAAKLYRASARRRSERLRVAAPLVACVILGGGATLLYGLSLFMPVVEMLRSLASVRS